MLTRDTDPLWLPYLLLFVFLIKTTTKLNTAAGNVVWQAKQPAVTPTSRLGIQALAALSQSQPPATMTEKALEDSRTAWVLPLAWETGWSS